MSDLQGLSSAEELQNYLREQTKFRFDDFIEAGRKENKPFNEIYNELRKLRGERGLSNSEAALAAALWSALQEGAEVRHSSLSGYFPASGIPRNLDELRTEILDADAIILSGPVYFGDRGSLAQSLIEFIAADNILRSSCEGKIYAGIAVGAKRNGGQETTLIYQMLDMVNLDFLAVGNNSETTSQYGGTVLAGDVGTMHEDEYGLNTCIGTGQRVARAAKLMKQGIDQDVSLRGPLKIRLLLLQDSKCGKGSDFFQDWSNQLSSESEDLDIKLINITNVEIVRCIACDICPTHVGPKSEYRCIIKASDDFFVKHHAELIDADALLLCAYNPEDRNDIVTGYQKFIERTRYLRRDNYVLSDLLCAPFVVSELSARQNLHMRMLTSSIRHHTILHHPLIGIVHEGKLLNENNIFSQGRKFLDRARELTIGRLRLGQPNDLLYHPVGYEVSAEQAKVDFESGRIRDALNVVADENKVAAEKRLTIK